MSFKVGFIGSGNMAGAIIEGILRKSIVPVNDLSVFDKDKSKLDKFRAKGIKAAETIQDLAKKCDIIFLSVKPQNYDEVLGDIKTSVDGSKVLVSIAAGISTDYIKKAIGFDCKAIRVMPNTPLLLGEGASAFGSRRSPVTEDEFNFAKSIFESGGIVEVLPEDKMNAVISVNGSSPAYVYLFAKAVIDSAVKQGIDAETAKKLIAKTLEGSAKMLTESGYTPEELIKMVSSPGGTTLKALEALYEHNFEAVVDDAMLRCTKRAEELGK